MKKEIVLKYAPDAVIVAAVAFVASYYLWSFLLSIPHVMLELGPKGIELLSDMACDILFASLLLLAVFIYGRLLLIRVKKELKDQ